MTDESPVHAQHRAAQAQANNKQNLRTLLITVVVALLVVALVLVAMNYVSVSFSPDNNSANGLTSSQRKLCDGTDNTDCEENPDRQAFLTAMQVYESDIVPQLKQSNIASTQPALKADIDELYNKAVNYFETAQYHTARDTLEQTRKNAERALLAASQTFEDFMHSAQQALDNRQPDAAKAAIDADGWLHTGDLGAMDERGYLRVTGRVKEMIIRGGENLFPAEIESTLLEHPSVAETAVIGVPDPKWGEIVACFVRPAKGEMVHRETLLKHCRQHLSPQKTPALWIEVDGWPLTGSGKIQKFVLLEQLEAGKFTTL